ncbi:DUF6398 domain-containing protein [Methylobacterium phyllosphaerae]
MPKAGEPRSVSKGMRPTYEAVTALTDAFCRDHLDDDYRGLAQRMTAALCRKRPSPLTSGQPRTWACGIVYTLGQINFLTDPSTQPFMTTADLCAKFGVGQSTANAKSRAISQVLDTGRLNPEWSLPSLLDQNPLVWMAEVNGFIVDLRDMPREVQVAAFEAGMIPYIPADQERSG